MNWYSDENRQALEARGIDYDLVACLEYNPQDFSLLDIERVLAVWEGERDGDHWRWVIRLHSGDFVLLDGWCDYTGWDCQSGTEAASFPTALEAVAHSRVTSSYLSNHEEVYAALMNQLRDGKDQTWRERMDDEMLGGAS